MGNVNTQGGSDVNYKDKYGDTPLHHACEEGLYTIAALLIERNAKVNCKSDDKNTPLHYACRHGHTDIARMLIQHKAIINCKNIGKITPLHYACARRNADIAKMLIQHGAEVNCKDDQFLFDYLDYVINDNGDIIFEVVRNLVTKFGATPLHIACAYGHVDITKILIEHGAKVNCKDEEKQTPLHFACGNGHADKVKILIDNKATVNCQNIYKRTPLHLALQYGFADVVWLLLNNNADLDRLNNWSQMPIHKSCETEIKNVKDVKLVPRHISDSVVNSRDIYGARMLHVASSSANIDLVKMLLELGADVNLLDNEGKLPIHYACRTRKNNIDIIKLFVIDLNVDVNCADRLGQTPLHVASEFGGIVNVKFLLEHGADINIADCSGKLPIHSAVRLFRYNKHVIKFYLDLKIDVNCRNKKNGQTPLHYASYYGEIKTTKILLDHNADVNIADYTGETALHKIVLSYLSSKSPTIIEMLNMLIDLGADINAKNNSGLTVLDLAKKRKRNDVTLYLKSLMKQQQ